MKLEVRYAAVLKQAKGFLSSAKKTVSGSNLSNTHLLLLLKHKADCPLCGVVFEGENHNSEHIHPRALGGANDSKNKIQLCKNCNNCKNSVMQRHLAMPPPYHKGYPDNWEAVKAFLLWSELTIDDGLMAGVAIPEVHKIFLEERFAGEQPRQGPKRAFGRASTLDKATGPNYPHNGVLGHAHPRPTTAPAGGRKKGFWERFATPVLDYLTGYGSGPEQSATTTTSSQPEKQQEAKEPSSATDPSLEEKSTSVEEEAPVKRSKPKQTAEMKHRAQEMVKTEGGVRIRRDLRGLPFEHAVSLVISHKQISLTTLANWLDADLKHFGILKEGDHYLTHFGYSKSKGLRGALTQEFPEMFLVESNGGTWHVESTMASYLKDWEALLLEADERGEPVVLTDFWNHIRSVSKPASTTWTDFLAPFSIKSKGPITGKVLAFLDRTNLLYEIIGEKPNHSITVSRPVYQPTEEPIVKASTSQSKNKDPQEKLQPTSKKYPEVEPGFQNHILRALRDVEGEFKLSTLSTMLEEYLESVGLGAMSFKQFAKSYGIPTRRTAIEIIEHYFSDTLAYRRQGETIVFVWRIDHEEE